MCGAISYEDNGELVNVYFPNPRATLPVLTKQGQWVMLPWGRRKTQTGNLPMGGWARLESIHQGRWNQYFAKPIKLVASAFMEKDIEGVSHWYPVIQGQYLQGLLARYDNERRVYVVTITPKRADALHERWPRIIMAG